MSCGQLDDLYLEAGLMSKRFMRTRVMRLAEGETVINKEEALADPENVLPKRSSLVMFEVMMMMIH